MAACDDDIVLPPLDADVDEGGDVILLPPIDDSSEEGNAPVRQRRVRPAPSRSRSVGVYFTIPYQQPSSSSAGPAVSAGPAER